VAALFVDIAVDSDLVRNTSVDKLTNLRHRQSKTRKFIAVAAAGADLIEIGSDSFYAKVAGLSVRGSALLIKRDRYFLILLYLLLCRTFWN